MTAARSPAAQDPAMMGPAALGPAALGPAALNIIPLRPWATCLVLLNLVFVHLTGAVPGLMLLPLYALTIGAPALARFQGRRSWRAAWNAAVVMVFLLLAFDLRRRHVSALLEHGMLLAALSQVHLLNNLDNKQRPDLLFFNSFLLAFVTAFFSQDVAFCLVFAAYVAVLLPSLQLYTMLAAGVQVPGPGAEDHGQLARTVLRSSLPQTGIALLITAVLFVVLPRDFQREGWVSQELLSSSGGAGYTEQVNLGSANGAVLSDRVVFTAQGDEPMPTHWRTATYLNFHRGSWRAVQQMAGPGIARVDPNWEQDRAGAYTREHKEDAHRTLLVQLVDPQLKRLPLPMEASRVELLPPLAPDRTEHFVDGTMRHLDAVDILRQRRGAAYRINVVTPAAVDVRPPEMNEWLRRPLILSRRANLPDALVELAAMLEAEATAAAGGSHPDPLHLATHVSNHLQEHHRYELPGQAGAARDLEDFLVGTKAGHCEYFASTLVLIMRHLQVPCRLVTGFMGAETKAGVLIVRRKHAHAWAEVLDPEAGWVVIDPTPAADDGSAAESGSWLSELGHQLQEWWKAVTTFNAEGQQSVLGWLMAAPGRLGSWLVGSPWGLGTMGVVVVLWVRRRRRRGIPEVLRLGAAMRRAGIERQPHETPRQILARPEIGTLEPPVRAALVAAVDAHEAERYGRP